MKPYFKNNSDTSKAVSFTVEGYSFSFDIAASQATGYSSLYGAITSPALNPLNTQISIEGERATYPDAWNNSNLTYFLGPNGLKENIVVSSLPAFSPLADFFRYRVNVYYNNSLQVCVDDVCYLHPSSVDLNTTGGIAFKDSDNKTIFNVPHGIITDSNGSSANLTYFLSLNNGIDIWYIGIPVSFLEDAVYPVYIDPSLYEYDDDTVIEQTTIGGADWRAQSFTIGTVGANEAFTITSINLFNLHKNPHPAQRAPACLGAVLTNL